MDSLKEMKEVLLKELYERKFDGKLYDVAQLLNNSRGIVIDHRQAQQLSQSLKKDNLIKAHYHKDGAAAEITGEGVEYFENQFHEYSYKPRDKFTKDEKEEWHKRLDKLMHEIEKLKKGQEIIYDDLKEDIENLKGLVNVLGKKDFGQIIKGKLFDVGLGEFTKLGFELVKSVFTDPNLLS